MENKNRKLRKVKGFTLIELIVVLAIIAIIAGFGLPRIQNALAGQNEVKGRDAMSTLTQAIVGTRGTATSPYVSFNLSIKSGSNYLVKNMAVDIPNSKAFSTVKTQNLTINNVASAITLTYSTNLVTFGGTQLTNANLKYTAEPQSVGGNTTNVIEGLSPYGEDGIPSIFTGTDKKLENAVVNDLFKLEELRATKKVSDDTEILLKGLLGESSDALPLTTSTKGVFGVKQIDFNGIKDQLPKGSDLVDRKLYTGYLVTGIVTLKDFKALALGTFKENATVVTNANIAAIMDASVAVADKDAVLSEIYEAITTKVNVGDVIWIPHSSKDIVYSKQSNFKEGVFVNK